MQKKIFQSPGGMVTRPRVAMSSALKVALLVWVALVSPALAEPIDFSSAKMEFNGKPTPITDQYLKREGDSWATPAAAPTGSYSITWSIPFPPAAKAVTITADFRKHNINQSNSLSISTDGGKNWQPAGGNTKDWTWETKSNTFLLDLFGPAADKLLLRWVFNKPHSDETWRVYLGKVQIQPCDAEKALAEWRKPLEKNLPILANPRTDRKGFTGPLELKDGMMFKKGKPFFPVGFVRGGSDRDLAQARAMGANAVSIDLGWFTSTGPGPIPQDRYNDFLAGVRDIAQWDMVSFVVLVGHYVPGWFAQKYPSSQYYPLGSDNQQTGHWMNYSLHFKPFRDEIPYFWTSAAKALANEPSILALNFWNEPCYGGAWAWPDQFADYRPFAIDDYRAHLQKKYQTIENLRTAHKQNYPSFQTLQPPRKPAEMGRAAWLDWMEYGQHYFADFFTWERQVIRAAAPKTLLGNKKQTNPWDNSTASSGTNWHLLAQSEDIFGINIYWSSLVGIRDILDAARCYATGRPVISFETNAMPPFAECTPDTVRVQLWAYVLGGIKGLFIYAYNVDGTGHGFVGGDKEIKPESRPEYTRFFTDVSKHQRELASPHVPAQIAVLYSTTGALQYTHNTIPRHMTGAFDLFRDSHYQTDLLPEERCDATNLARYKLIVLPSYSVLKKPTLDALTDFVKKGGKIFAFGKSLATDEYLNPIAPPAVLGIETRKPPIGDNTSQPIVKLDHALVPYVEGEPTVTGVEMVSYVKESEKRFIQGEVIQARQPGKALALNKDGYPAVLLAPGGHTIYCAFDSVYSAPLRGLVEAVTREVFGLKQHVRLLRDQLVEPGVMTSLRQDYLDPNTRYLLVINTLPHPRTLNADLEPNWTVQSEIFHPDQTVVESDHVTVKLAPREVYLFSIRKKQ